MTINYFKVLFLDFSTPTHFKDGLKLHFRTKAFFSNNKYLS